MTHRAGWFVAIALAVGALGLAFAWTRAEVPQALAGYALTMLPALATFLWAVWTFRNAPELQLLAGLGGSGARMAVALGGGLALRLVDPVLFDTEFWLWLVAYYLIFLTLDITLLVRGQARPGAGGSPGA